MEIYTVAAVILGVSALFSVFNARVLRLPETIGLMTTGLMASTAVLLLGSVYEPAISGLCHQVMAFDFSGFVLDFALGFLIFAGAFGSDTAAMNRDRWPILTFATIGILISTFLVGGLVFGVTQLLGIEISFIHCLLFGALISPTDPIAVLAILKGSPVPRSLQADIAGESLLNDGIAVVVFLTILELAGGGHGSNDTNAAFSIAHVISLFGREVLGGVMLGLISGWLGAVLLRKIKSSSIAILVSLAIVMACQACAWKLHVSGPLALVVVGLIFGRLQKTRAESKIDTEHLNSFWEGIDHVLNAVLFTLMGLVLLGLSEEFNSRFLFAGLLAIPAVLLSRLVSVSLPIPFTKLRAGNPGTTIALLTWGGLRGGISIALALTLPEELSRNLLLHMTYIVVAFSILVQGLSINSLVRRLIPKCV